MPTIGVSNSAVQALREAGHEVFRLRDVLPVESADDLVIAKAQTLNAILLSLNGDFADILNYPPQRYKGIVALQIRNHPEISEHLLERLVRYFGSHPEPEHCHGKLLLVEVSRIRLRE